MLDGDWSSDVCSSDLATLGPYTAATLMGWFGAKSLFAFTATVQVFFIAYIMTRLLQRPG
jgi:hypothetical protein